jgi:hypothetical protein
MPRVTKIRVRKRPWTWVGLVSPPVTGRGQPTAEHPARPRSCRDPARPDPPRASGSQAVGPARRPRQNKAERTLQQQSLRQNWHGQGELNKTFSPSFSFSLRKMQNPIPYSSRLPPVILAENSITPPNVKTTRRKNTQARGPARANAAYYHGTGKQQERISRVRLCQPTLAKQVKKNETKPEKNYYSHRRPRLRHTPAPRSKSEVRADTGAPPKASRTERRVTHQGRNRKTPAIL